MLNEPAQNYTGTCYNRSTASKGASRFSYSDGAHPHQSHHITRLQLLGETAHFTDSNSSNSDRDPIRPLFHILALDKIVVIWRRIVTNWFTKLIYETSHAPNIHNWTIISQSTRVAWNVCHAIWRIPSNSSAQLTIFVVGEVVQLNSRLWTIFTVSVLNLSLNV